MTLRDKRVRRALAMSVPMSKVVADFYGDTARAIVGPFTPEEAAYNRQLLPIGHSPAEAKRLFAEAGWTDGNGDGLLDKDGKPLAIALLVPQTNQDFPLVLRDALLRAGVRLEVTVMDFNALNDHVRAGKYQAAYIHWTNRDDSDLFARFHSSQFPDGGRNDTRYVNPQVDALIERVRAERDARKREELNHQLHQLIADDQPYGFYVQVAMKWGVNKRVGNVTMHERTGLFLWYPGPLSWSLTR